MNGFLKSVGIGDHSAKVTIQLASSISNLGLILIVKCYYLHADFKEIYKYSKV